MTGSILLDTILNEYADQLGMTTPVEKDSVFEIFAAEQLLKQKDLDSEEIRNGLIGGGKDNGIDGFYIFVDDEYISSYEQLEHIKKAKNIEVHIHQYKNSNTIEENVVHKFNTATSSIFDLETVFSPVSWNTDLIERIHGLRKIIIQTASAHPVYKIIYRHICKGDRFNIYNDDAPNESYIDKVRILQTTLARTDIGSAFFDFDLVGRRELVAMNREEKQFSLSLKLNENPIALDFSGDDKRGYIASANLKDYFNFITDQDSLLRNYLFDSNIRDFQNNTVTNSEISNTIKEEKELDFWWLNNGVTILADKGSLTGKTLNLDNVQIVNGLQTSYSIYNTLSEGEFPEEKRSVLLKIIITDNKVTSDRVIKSTNSQNPVPTSLLRATDTIQRDIEEFFLSHDYYYDRRKNYYKNLKKPTKKIISINFLAQCLTSLVITEKNPSKARSNPTILTKEDTDYQELFTESRDPNIYLKSIQVVKKVEQIIKDILTIEQGDELDEKLKKYYLFHISRVAVSVLLSKPNYHENEMLKITIDSLNEQTVRRSLEILKAIIRAYIEETTYSDIVNISKQTEFSRYITSNYLRFAQVSIVN
ncbi:AIPR family protein [Solibacillus daqui]|uniref:AIPR family protein n=1 Tax=Solibacillus daqui TaxID=2912187 RepID=UPI002365AEF0|nr:AIPR family protein [Solibacillus daqui]